MPILHAPHGGIATPEIKFADNTIQSSAAPSPFLDIEYVDGTIVVDAPAVSITITETDIFNKVKVIWSNNPLNTEIILPSTETNPNIPIGAKFLIMKDPWSDVGPISFNQNDCDVLSNFYPSDLTQQNQLATVTKLDDWTWYVDQNKQPEPTNFTDVWFSTPDPNIEQTINMDVSYFKRMRIIIAGNAWLDFPTNLKDGDEVIYNITRESSMYHVAFHSNFIFNGPQPSFAEEPSNAVMIIRGIYDQTKNLLFCIGNVFVEPLP